MNISQEALCLSGGKVEAEVVAVGFVGFQTEYRSKTPHQTQRVLL
jgi:hypothetical protein